MLIRSHLQSFRGIYGSLPPVAYLLTMPVLYSESHISLPKIQAHVPHFPNGVCTKYFCLANPSSTLDYVACYNAHHHLLHVPLFLASVPYSSPPPPLSAPSPIPYHDDVKPR